MAAYLPIRVVALRSGLLSYPGAGTAAGATWVVDDGACVGVGYPMLAGGGECCERRGYYFRVGQDKFPRRWMWEKGSC